MVMLAISPISGRSYTEFPALMLMMLPIVKGAYSD
jgi:hypothetical protein